MSNSHPATVIEGDRWKAARAFLVLLACGGASLVTVTVADGPLRFAGLAGVVFFGGAALRCLMWVFSPPKLVLTDEGLRWKGPPTFVESWMARTELAQNGAPP